MLYSTTMRAVVMPRAAAEARYRKQEKPSVEDLFLGILKLSEMKAEDFLKAPAIMMRVTDIEIHALSILFRDVYKVDTTHLRARLRLELTVRKMADTEHVDEYYSRAEEIAHARNSKEIFPCDLLSAIVEKPTLTLMQVCEIAEWNPNKKKDVKTAEKPDESQRVERSSDKSGGSKAPERSADKSAGPKETDKTTDRSAGSNRAEKTGSAGGNGNHNDPYSSDGDNMEAGSGFLPELTSNIRKLRAKLLSTVQGQDHVVHAFAEGMFAAEVLAESDTSRKRPKAIFAFVGPPGVGKTFLAEQAAESLGLPFKRFDMSSYADHQTYMGLVGFEKSYSGAARGLLTEFVEKNPKCILLFDEIEKAHINTIQLFLQILDAGRLNDRYTGEAVNFRDTIIIFTSNAGKSLYEGDTKQNAAGIPRKTILGALETEKDPRTGEPFFPAAITSRLATGWPILFNHLSPHDLEKISARELRRVGDLFEKQYKIRTKVDDLTATALLFREGGAADARTLRAQTELFFKNEIFKVCRLWSEDSFAEALKKLDTIRFIVDTDTLTPDLEPLFFSEEKPEILVYGEASFVEKCRNNLPGYIFYQTTNTDEVLRLAGENDIRLVLLDVSMESQEDFDPMATVYEDMTEKDRMLSVGAFDYKPMAASLFHDGRSLFKTLRERLPELPVYLLESGDVQIDEELLLSFVRAGARGKIEEPESDFSVFEDMLQEICREIYLQNVAAMLAAERKVISFETAPRLLRDKKEVFVRLRDFSLKRAPSAEDTGSVLDEVEKPNIHFTDVIGANDAKDELGFFIEYLKNPRKFCAQGLTPPKGVLLYGPPGTGKTMLAKAMAGESDVAFIPAVASSFVTKYQGSGPESVRALFMKARRYAPSIIFIDEIDAIGRKRDASHNAHGEEMALNALLTEMDGFSVDPKRPVFVLAATNFDVEEGRGGMGVIDPALSRRFDRKILIDLPNADDREKLLRLLLSKNIMCEVSDEMIRRTAKRAVGMSPANLTSVIELANRMAVKAGKAVDDAVLDEAFELTRHGEKKDWGYEYLERVARHESGHAFLCYLGGNTPSYLTIVARGSHGGYMEHSSKEMGPLSTKEELINRIRTSLGGRAAEIAYYGEKDGVSTGASGDLEQATRVASAMISVYGMDDDFGLAYMDPKEAMRDPAFRKKVNEILGREMREAVEIIQKNRTRIDRMVAELLKKNKLTGDEIEKLLEM